MKDFIKQTRIDRRQEIISYENKGYTFENKNTYFFINRICVNYYGNNLVFGIQVNDEEPYFIYVFQGANINLSISELYNILNYSARNGTPIVDDLQKQLGIKDSQSEFMYNNNKYRMIKPIHVDDSSVMKIPDTNIDIPYNQLIVLMALIQSKSNAFFNNSSDAKQKYMNGIYRLLICMLILNKDHLILKKRGWIWNEMKREFELHKELAESDSSIFKYYLTQEEMGIIMEI